MKKNNIFTAIFCIIFFAWLIEISGKEAISMGSSDIEVIETKEFIGVASVTDGDTIKIAEKRIRLIGIDAPESSQNCFDANYDEYPCGKISKEFLIKLADKKEVKCVYEKLDKYKRYLSKCYVGDISINNALLKNGMAVTYFFGKINQEMADFENEAKENKIGIWQGPFEMPKDYRKAHPYSKAKNNS